MSVPEYVLVFAVHLFLPCLRGLMFHVLSHIWLQVGRGLKTNKGQKVMDMGRSIKNSTIIYVIFALHQVKNRMLCASDSLSHFNIWSSRDKTSIEAK